MNHIDVDLNLSTQINNGLKETCADGASLAFDKKYGIMFCAYMPGFHGDYGESRGKIMLSYFPASQPTNIRFVEISSGHEDYVPNIISLGDGMVRVFYEKDSRKDTDHNICYKDFDFKSEVLSNEKIVEVSREGGKRVPLALSECFDYLEKNGYHDHIYHATEQIIFGGHTPFLGDDGYYYGSITSELSEAILYRSRDHLATLEFFAIYPRQVEYEFDYGFLDGAIYAIYRTNKSENGCSFVYSEDGGKSWAEPIVLASSIQCRPRMITSQGNLILCYNCLNNDSGHRPSVIMGRTEVKLCIVKDHKPEEVLSLHSKYGIVNIALADILGDVYMAYSTSELALEYQNGTPYVRGKDAIRYIKIGCLS